MILGNHRGEIFLKKSHHTTCWALLFHLQLRQQTTKSEGQKTLKKKTPRRRRRNSGGGRCAPLKHEGNMSLQVAGRKLQGGRKLAANS